MIDGYGFIVLLLLLVTLIMIEHRGEMMFYFHIMRRNEFMNRGSTFEMCIIYFKKMKHLNLIYKILFSTSNKFSQKIF